MGNTPMFVVISGRQPASWMPSSATAARLRELALSKWLPGVCRAVNEGDQEVALSYGQTKPASAPGSSAPTT